MNSFVKSPIFFIFVLCEIQGICQVSISTNGNQPDPSSMLDIQSQTKGFLLPRVGLIDASLSDPIVSPATGLHVYNTAISGILPNNVTPGDYCWNGSRWISATMPAGTYPGEMLYWNGTQWISIPPGINGQVLTLWNGVPGWGQNFQQVPTVITAITTNITGTTAISGGNISDGGSIVTSRGLCWSTNPSPTTADNVSIAGGGSGTFSGTLTGLSENAIYFVRATATNGIGTAYGNEVTFISRPCGHFITLNHLTSGGVAPVDKTVTYGTITNIPGEASKCWITSNLGAEHEGAMVSDTSEASAGWYWQFNRKQGYMHDRTHRTPITQWTYPIDEDLDWQSENDPCAIEMGEGWRLPTFTEWLNVDLAGSWVNWNGPWNSGLKLHVAGYLDCSSGILNSRGHRGSYWSSTQDGSTEGLYLTFVTLFSDVESYHKSFGFSVRCLSD